MYTLKMYFTDGKELQVSLKEEQMQGFCSAIGKNEIFFSNENNGIWINLDLLRYFTIKKEAKIEDQDIPHGIEEDI